MNAIGIDIGTTSICLVSCEEGKEELSLVLSRENVFCGETFEQDADVIVRKVMEMLKEAENRGYLNCDTKGIGISSQMHGIVYVDKNGQAVSPLYTWKDRKGTENFCGEISYETFLRQKGFDVHTGYGIVTHFYLSQKKEIPDGAVKFAGIGDYLAMRLTGSKVPYADCTMAASLGGFDLQKRDFDFEKLHSAGINTVFLPEVCKGEKPAGYYKNLPVTWAYGDNQASFYAAMENPETQVSVNIGTGSQVSVWDSRLIENTSRDIRPFFNESYLYVGASVNGGKVYEKLASFFEETVYAFTGKKIRAYDVMAELADEKENTDLSVNPSLYGARGNAGQSGKIENLTERNFHPTDFIRAYVRGMAEELYALYKLLPPEITREKKEIIASGNGIRKNRILKQEIERVFGLPVHFQMMEEEAATGAARRILNMKEK